MGLSSRSFPRYRESDITKAAKAMDRRPRTRISPHSIGLLNKVLVKASRSASPADLATSSFTSPMFLKVQIAMKPIKNGAMA